MSYQTGRMEHDGHGGSHEKQVHTSDDVPAAYTDVAMENRQQNNLQRNLKGRHMQMIAMLVS